MLGGQPGLRSQFQTSLGYIVRGYPKNKRTKTGEMAQPLIVLAACAEDLSSDPNNYVTTHDHLEL